VPATIVKGSTFSTTVTAGGLHALVESATISGIDRANMKSDTSVATKLAVPPTAPVDNEVWQEANSNFLSTYDAATSNWKPALSTGEQFVLSSFSLPIAAGDLLFPSNEGTADPTVLSDYSTASSNFAVGVATQAMVAGGRGVYIANGLARVKSSGTIAAGHAVKPQIFSGAVVDAGALGAGFGPLVIGVALEAASGGFVWINLRR
jgi:hypothetical protein